MRSGLGWPARGRLIGRRIGPGPEQDQDAEQRRDDGGLVGIEHQAGQAECQRDLAQPAPTQEGRDDADDQREPAELLIAEGEHEGRPARAPAVPRCDVAGLADVARLDHEQTDRDRGRQREQRRDEDGRTRHHDSD